MPEIALEPPFALVRPQPSDPSRGVVEAGKWRWDCALGRGGVRLDKREGDGATPIGNWPIRQILYHTGKVSLPPLPFTTRAIQPGDGWCDDPGNPKYNQAVRHPFPGGAEHLWREDDLYDIVGVLGHNDNPPIAWLGSAIFLHIATPEYAPTAGCVALRREDLLALLAHLPTIRTLRIAGA
jgi:L,D-peptidoglycan transpeptidase YkuD (ErfK/YbiS/YcfS/YnhG family)